MSREDWQAGNTHCVIPDTQAKPGVPLNHMQWLGDYIADKQPQTLVHIGDHWDMPSLSEYDKGKKAAEGKRYAADIASGNYAMDLLMAPIYALQKKQKKAGQRIYNPRRVFCVGNHEERILRHINANAHLDGKIGYHDFNLEAHGWEVHEFLHVVKIDGVAYAHYFAQPNTGKPYGGQPLSRLKEIGFTFTMGHQQGKAQAERYLSDGSAQRALIVGSYYAHDEKYKGPQGNHHWRGIVMKHEVAQGTYDLMEVSMGYLARRFRARYPRASRKAIIYRG